MNHYVHGEGGIVVLRHFEHEALVLVDLLPAFFLDGQVEGLDVDDEVAILKSILSPFAAFKVAALMLELRLLGYIGFTDFHRNLNRGVLRERSRTLVVRQNQRWLRSDHGRRIGNSLAMLPHLEVGSVVLLFVIRRFAQVDLAVLEGQLRLEDVDLGRVVLTGFYRCRCARAARTVSFRRYSNFNGVGCVFGQIIKLVRNDVALCILYLDLNIHIFGLPRIKAVGFFCIVCLTEIKVDITGLDRRAVLELIGGHTAQQIHVLIRGRNGHILDGDVDLGLLEGHDRGLRGAVLVDACACVSDNIVAAQETSLRLNLKADNQLMAPIGDTAVLGDCTDVVLGEVEAGDVHLIAADGCLCAHCIGVFAPSIVGAILAGAAIRFQCDTAHVRSLRERELRGDDVLHNSIGGQRGRRAASLNLVGNLLENIVQRTRIRSGEVVTGRLRILLIGRNALQEIIALIRIAAAISCTACAGSISTGENTDCINRCAIGSFSCVGLSNRTAGNTAVVTTQSRNTICKNDYNTITLFSIWNRVLLKYFVSHCKAVISACAAPSCKRIYAGSYTTQASICIHRQKCGLILRVADTPILGAVHFIARGEVVVTIPTTSANVCSLPITLIYSTAGEQLCIVVVR